MNSQLCDNWRLKIRKCAEKIRQLTELSFVDTEPDADVFYINRYFPTVVVPCGFSADWSVGDEDFDNLNGKKGEVLYLYQRSKGPKLVLGRCAFYTFAAAKEDAEARRLKALSRAAEEMIALTSGECPTSEAV